MPNSSRGVDAPASRAAGALRSRGRGAPRAGGPGPGPAARGDEPRNQGGSQSPHFQWQFRLGPHCCTTGSRVNLVPPAAGPHAPGPESNRDPAYTFTAAFADDGAFAFGSRRDVELGARILYDHCVRWGVMPHTAGQTVTMHFGQPVANLREFLPDEAIPPIKMGDGEAPVAQEFEYLPTRRLNAKQEL